MIASVLSRLPKTTTSSPVADPKALTVIVRQGSARRLSTGNEATVADVASVSAIRRHSAFCIYNLTCDAECIDDAVAGGLAKVLATLIKPPETGCEEFLRAMDKTVQHTAAEAMCNIASGSPETIHKVVSVGVIVPMLGIMSSCSRAETVHVCLLCFVRLSCHRTCIKRLVGEGLLPAISKVCSGHRGRGLCASPPGHPRAQLVNMLVTGVAESDISRFIITLPFRRLVVRLLYNLSLVSAQLMMTSAIG